MNLIDAARQWFKAEVGLGVRETPLETSICAHAILEEDFVEIPDTLQDRRMQDNALCAGDAGLRFYAGALLKGEDGLPLGTLCVLDYQPRVLTELQRTALKVLAKQVMAQLNLRRALARQSLLNKEVDHRVKNSLASVAALVGMQINRAEDPALKASLQAVEQRIRTISLLHEALYQTTALDQVDLAAYLPKLRTMLQAGAPENVKIEFALEPVLVDSRNASALGIIISEFVANSCKHAFPRGEAGRIDVRLTRSPAGAVELRCADDGVGDERDASQKSRGLGLRIIEASAHTLGGQVERSPMEKGFCLTIRFPA